MDREVVIVRRGCRAHGLYSSHRVNPAPSEYGVFPLPTRSYNDVDDVRVRQVVHEYYAPDTRLHA